MSNHKIRTTITPGEIVTVDDAGLVDHDRLGLIYSSESGEYGKHKWKGEEAEAAEPVDEVTDEGAKPARGAAKKGA